MKSHLPPSHVIAPQTSAQSTVQVLQHRSEIRTVWHRRKLPTYLFLALCSNTLFAPAVLAATGGELDRLQAWALTLLGVATVALSAYLFAVMFQPEKF
ncbi:MAG: potassium-transporting ATPase subunit F [Oscillatoriophycideae cyanobacterium NC_groundwater_1537_Pr4_S-0.65um_50_18]|nr:potassium-transporting ATPase subunit F [Oscillatoriophycideae cyanobacterium NC_groundwater_1537_Pr4_S-0.65um_50_18]